jgi:NADPH:quinone reductase-like Zn-dependent oxidoreductase
LQDNDILVKVAYVAQNPTGKLLQIYLARRSCSDSYHSALDWKHVEFWGKPEATDGCDFSGKVVALGKNLKDDSWQIGDLAAGIVHGGQFPDRGAFAGTSLSSSMQLWS